MKTALFALVMSQAGCIFTSVESGDEAFITAEWSVFHLESQANIPCPPGFDTAALHSVPIDDAGNATGVDNVDMFACESGKGTSAPLVRGLYRSWIEIADSEMSDVFATSLSATVDITAENRRFTTQILDDGGYFQMTWNLVGASSGNELTCDQAGATNGVESVASEISTPDTSASDEFDCADFEGLTAGHLAADYTISVKALGADENPVGSAPVMTNKTIQARNRVTDLGPITIPIPGM